jgi:hypothetical protein
MKLKDKWLQIINNMNSKGIPIPMVRDEGRASESLTLVVISSLLVIIGIVGKYGLDLKIDVNQALQFFYASAGLHFGRTWINGSNRIEGTNKEEKEKNTSENDNINT